MKNKTIALFVAMTMTVLMTGCGQSTPAASSAASTQAASSAVTSSTTAASTTSEASSSTTVTETSVDGVVIDAAMHSLVIQTKDGQTISAASGEDTEPDTSGLKNGLVLGKGITLTYTGDPANDNTVTIVSEADCDTKCDDSDGLALAGSIILAVEDKDLDALMSCVTYPTYVGIGDGLEIKDEDEFKEKVKADDIFTDELVDAVSHTDLLDIESNEAGLVITSDKDGAPNIIISKADDGTWGISGINFTKQ